MTTAANAAIVTESDDYQWDLFDEDGDPTTTEDTQEVETPPLTPKLDHTPHQSRTPQLGQNESHHPDSQYRTPQLHGTTTSKPKKSSPKVDSEKPHSEPGPATETNESTGDETVKSLRSDEKQKGKRDHRKTHAIGR